MQRFLLQLPFHNFYSHTDAYPETLEMRVERHYALRPVSALRLK